MGWIKILAFYTTRTLNTKFTRARHFYLPCARIIRFKPSYLMYTRSC